MSYLSADLPPITVSTTDFERLQRLADAAAATFPRTADFLANEIARAEVVDASRMLPGVVTMDSEVQFRDDSTGQVRRVTLVYPDQADVNEGRISVLTPIGAALIGLSVSQRMEWQTPGGDRRSLTVLSVRNPKS